MANLVRGSVLISIATVVSAAVGETVAYKQIGAPPSDVTRGWLQAPDPAEVGARSRCTQIPFVTEDGAIDIAFDVPSCGHLAVVPMGIGCAAWNVSLIRPDGSIAVSGVDGVLQRTDSLMPIADESGTRFDVGNPAPGRWTASLSGLPSAARGVLLVRDDAPFELRSTLDTYSLLEGAPVTLKCSLMGIDGGEAQITSCTAQWRGPDGRWRPIDVTQRNGERTVTLTPPAGEHVVQVDVDAIATDSGQLLHRTLLHLVKIESSPPVLSGEVSMESIDEARIDVALGCAAAGPREKLLAGAEVWATGDQGATLCGWIGGMAAVDEHGVHLTLDTRWIAAAGCDGAGVELRAVRLADPKSAITLAKVASVSLGTIEVCRRPVTASGQEAMHMGKPDRGSVDVTPPARGGLGGGHNLMLVHGYCSSGVSWPAGHFSGDVSMYQNSNQNFSHDEFAIDVASFGLQYKSYGIAGHSQGGQAALHMYSFYWTGLDWATPSPQDGGRIIQNLGVPYYGTALAGDLALLGEIFGAGCGVNWDMTYDGAANWLSYVPGWARAQTWSWTTTFYDGWGYDYCHLGTDLFLWDPEDGVVESFSGELDGGNFRGLKEGWCHIHGMSDPAQVDDSSRNNEINVEAAR